MVKLLYLAERLAILGFSSYREYLENSRYWHNFRALVVQNVCFACERWWPEWNIEVHHITYERLGAEIPEDVVSLCKKCHKWTTKMIDRGEGTQGNAHLKLRSQHRADHAQLVLNFDNRCLEPDFDHVIDALFEVPRPAV